MIDKNEKNIFRYIGFINKIFNCYRTRDLKYLYCFNVY